MATIVQRVGGHLSISNPVSDVYRPKAPGLKDRAYRKGEFAAILAASES